MLEKATGSQFCQLTEQPSEETKHLIWLTQNGATALQSFILNFFQKYVFFKIDVFIS